MLGVAFFILFIIAFLPQDAIDDTIKSLLDPDTWFGD